MTFVRKPVLAPARLGVKRGRASPPYWVEMPGFFWGLTAPLNLGTTMSDGQCDGQG